MKDTKSKLTLICILLELAFKGNISYIKSCALIQVQFVEVENAQEIYS